MSTTQPKTFANLLEDLQNRLREQTGVTATEDIAKRFLNTALQDMHVGFGEKFPWAERQATILTHARYTTGTVTIAQGSTALTGDSTAWDTANDFGVKNALATGKLSINGTPEIYTIASVDSDTGITLNERYVGDDASEATYTYFEDEYALSADFLRPLDLQFFDQAREIDLIPRNEFRRRYPRNNLTGKPLVATIVDRPFSGDTTPVRRVMFWKPPDAAYLLPYSFVTNKLAVSSAGTAQESLSADADEPIVPMQFRHAIVYHALHHIYRDRKDDARSQEAKAEFTDLMLRISSDHEIGRPRPQLQPRISPYVSYARNPYRRRGTRYTTGTAFDERR